MNTQIILTHASTGEAIDVTASLIAAVYKADMKKISDVPVNLVLFNGGAMIPVKESAEEIRKLKQTKNEGELN